MLLDRTQFCLRWPLLAGAMTMLGMALPPAALADADDAAPASTNQRTFISTGQYITPTAAPGSTLQYLNPGLPDYPNFIASGALSSVKSPDGKTLLVLVSGYNSLSVPSGQTEGKTEYIFVFDISSGTPAQKQVIQIPNSYVGICFAPDGGTFYVGGGQDDNVHTFTPGGDGTWAETGTPIALGHGTALALYPGDYPPETAGLGAIRITNFVVSLAKMKTAEAVKPRSRPRAKRIASTGGRFRISDELWALMEPLLPEHKNTHRFGGGRPRVPDRQCADAIFFVLRTGCQ